MTSSLLARVLFKPRALMAHSCELTWGTSRLDARRNASGRLVAAERWMSSLVMTCTAEGDSASFSGRRVTTATSWFISASRLNCFKSAAEVTSLVAGGVPNAVPQRATPSSAQKTVFRFLVDEHSEPAVARACNGFE